MITIQVKVTGHELSLVSSPILSSDSIQFDRINFQFDSNWDGFNKVALFWGGDSDTPYGSLVDAENNATIPAEVIAEKSTIRFGVYGEDPEDLRPRITSTILKYKVREGAWSDAVAGDDELSETLIDQLKEIAYAAYGNAEQFIEDAQEYLTQARTETQQNIAQNNAAVAANIQQNNAATTGFIAEARETTQEYLDEVTEMAEGAKDSAKVAAQAAIDAAAPCLTYSVLHEYAAGSPAILQPTDSVSVDDVGSYDYLEVVFRIKSYNDYLHITSKRIALNFGNDNYVDVPVDYVIKPYFTDINASPAFNHTVLDYFVLRVNRSTDTISFLTARGYRYNESLNDFYLIGPGSGVSYNTANSIPGYPDATKFVITKIIGWKYSNIASKELLSHDPELLDVRIAADGTIYASAGDAVRAHEDAIEEIADDVADLKSALTDAESILTVYASSVLTGVNSLGNNRRYLLNVGNPVQPNMNIGRLCLVANDSAINCQIRVELTTLNLDGTYSVYKSVTKTYNASGFAAGDLIPVMDVGMTTNAETYVFVTISGSTYSRFRIASISGKTIIVSDTTTGDTITTRVSSGYEVLFKLYCGATNELYANVVHGMDNLNQAVGNYERHVFFNLSQSSGIWNSYIYKSVPSGTKVRFFIAEYTRQAGARFNVRAFDANGNNQLLGTFDSADTVIEGILTLDAVNFRFQVAIQTAVTNEKLVVDYSDDRNGIVRDLMLSSVPRVFHIEKDGSGDFTNLAQGILAATQWMDSIVYVGPGTWDILSELGADYLAAVSGIQSGIVLKNRVHVICSSKAYIKCLYSGSDANVINYLSAFNAGPYGFTLENADIEVANVRYCVHDERNAETDHYDNYYINCRMKNTNQTSGSRSQCIGGGLGYDGHIVIDGCTFENPLRENCGVVSYHNAHGAATDSRSLIEVKGCYFYGKNTFRAGYYGNTTAITQCLVHGNSMGAEPYMTQEDASFTNVNMEIIAWNNEIRTA